MNEPALASLDRLGLHQGPGGLCIPWQCGWRRAARRGPRTVPRARCGGAPPATASKPVHRAAVDARGREPAPLFRCADRVGTARVRARRRRHRSRLHPSRPRAAAGGPRPFAAAPMPTRRHDPRLLPGLSDYHMLDANGRYCASDPGCGQCLDSQPAQWPLSIGDWRDSFGRVLRSASRVIAPSADCATRIAAFFPGIAPVVWPHPEGEPPEIPQQVRVLVPGALSRAKGLDLLEACVADSAARNLALHFRVLGFVARPLATWPKAPLSISGEFPDGKLPELMALERGDVCFLPSQCPETFSYALSAALDSGLPIVATGIGAFPGRVAVSPNARIVPWNASPPEINDVLVATVSPAASSPAPRSRMTFDAYRLVPGLPRGLEIEPRGCARRGNHHRTPMAFGTHRRARPPTPRVLLRRRRDLRESRIARGPASPGFDRIRASRRRMGACGNSSRASRRRMGARELIEAIAVAEENRKRIEGSFSWRMTAPLRDLARRLRRRARS